MTAPGGVVGIDVGATLAKVAALAHPGGTAHFASSDLEAVRAHVEALAPARIGVTGGGAPALGERLAGAPVRLVPEFHAWAAGAALLADAAGVPLPPRHLLASVGTGTSILQVESGCAIRVGGTAVGGGTFVGLGRLLLGTGTFAEIARLAAAGDRREVDLLVGEVYPEGAAPLVADLTASNFAKLRSTRREDVAAALAGLVGETVALMAGALGRAAEIDTIVYCGSTLEENAALTAVVAEITVRFGQTPRFLPRGAFCGAFGAAAAASDG